MCSIPAQKKMFLLIISWKKMTKRQKDWFPYVGYLMVDFHDLSVLLQVINCMRLS